MINILFSIIKKSTEKIDFFNDKLGILISWLTLGCVINCFIVVILRYVFSIGFPWMQELYVWQHSIIFLGGAGFTFLHNNHVNVDIAYSQFRIKTKCYVDILGTLFFLFPWVFVIAYSSSSFIKSSWRIYEPSSQTNGMPGLFLLKSMIWLFCLIIFLQGLSLIGKRVLLLLNYSKTNNSNNLIEDVEGT